MVVTHVSNVRFCSASAASTATAVVSHGPLAVVSHWPLAVVSHGPLPSVSACDADAPRCDLLCNVWIVIQRFANR